MHNTPYRKSLASMEIINILYEMVAKGEIDKMIVNVVAENSKECYAISTETNS